MSGKTIDYVTGSGCTESPRGVLIGPDGHVFDLLRERQARAKDEQDASDVDGTIHFRRTEDGMWLSKRAWGILRHMLMHAEYSRNGGGIKLPLDGDTERLCHLHDMVESSGLEMERHC